MMHGLTNLKINHVVMLLFCLFLEEGKQLVKDNGTLWKLTCVTNVTQVQNVVTGLIDVEIFEELCFRPYAGCSYVIIELNSILALFKMDFAHSTRYVVY